MEMKILSQILAEVLHVDCREVTQDMTLAGDLDADSLDLYQVLQRVEETFGTHVSEQEFRHLKTVRDILWVIRRNRTEVRS